MILGVALLAGVVLAWLLGAKPSRLVDLNLRGGPFVFAALAIQLCLFTRIHGHVPGQLFLPLQVATYSLLAVFLIVNMRAGRALILVVLGLVANLLPILTNGGRMPISLSAWTATGTPPELIQRTGHYANNVLAGPHSHFAWLGDIFALPASVPYASALSVGDVLMTFGLTAFVYRACIRPRAGALPLRILEPLRFDSFRSLIIGRTVSKLGDWLTMAAIVTWIFQRTHSTFAVSAFLVARIAGIIGGGVIAAPLLNRIPQFRTLSTVEALRGILMLVTLAFAKHGLVAPVIGLVCLSSMLGAATNPSASSLVPELLPDRLLHQGNALHGVTRNVVMVAGTGLGALSMGTLGIAPSLLIDLGTFALAALLYLHLSASADPVGPETPDAEPAQSRRQLLRGILSNRVIFGLTASFTLVTGAIGLLNASLPQFLARQVAQPQAYGYALAAIGLGLMCGEFLTGFIERESVARRSVALAFFVSGVVVFLASQSTVAATIYLLLFLLGASDGSTEVVYDTLFQRQLPRQNTAGTFALASAIQNGGMLVGLLAAPIVLQTGDSTTAFRLSAVGCVVGTMIAALALFRRPRVDENALGEESAGRRELSPA